MKETIHSFNLRRIPKNAPKDVNDVPINVQRLRETIAQTGNPARKTNMSTIKHIQQGETHERATLS
jgi:hypothetical protein